MKSKLPRSLALLLTLPSAVPGQTGAPPGVASAPATAAPVAETARGITGAADKPTVTITGGDGSLMVIEGADAGGGAPAVELRTPEPVKPVENPPTPDASGGGRSGLFVPEGGLLPPSTPPPPARIKATPGAARPGGALPAESPPGWNGDGRDPLVGQGIPRPMPGSGTLTLTQVSQMPRGEQTIQEIRLKVLSRHLESTLSESIEADKAAAFASGKEREELTVKANVLREFAAKLEGEIRSQSQLTAVSIRPQRSAEGAGGGSSDARPSIKTSGAVHYDGPLPAGSTSGEGGSALRP